MSISGCTSCQLGGVEALKAYDQAFERRRIEDAANDTKKLESEAARNRERFQNQPIAGAVIGSSINISV